MWAEANTCNKQNGNTTFMDDWCAQETCAFESQSSLSLMCII